MACDHDITHKISDFNRRRESTRANHKISVCVVKIYSRMCDECVELTNKKNLNQKEMKIKIGFSFSIRSLSG